MSYGNYSDGWSYKMNVKFAGDSRFVTLQDPGGSAVDKIKQLETYYFNWNSLGNDLGFGRVPEGESAPRQIGLIAQELQAVEPSLVKIMADVDGEDFYRIDYMALNVMVLDALNELNSRADNIKLQLGMPVETYPQKVNASYAPAPSYTFDSITANPVNGTEGTDVTWRINATGVPAGVGIGFRFDGTFNQNDVTILDQAEGVSIFKLDPTVVYEDGSSQADDIAAFGILNGHVVWGTEDYVDIKLRYVSDETLEGTEEITMSLHPTDSLGNSVPALTATGTISDS